MTGIREPFPESKEVLIELFRRGYRLGVVSNTVSSFEVPEMLEKMGLTGCIETVISSCVVGMRKPDPVILLEATNRMEIDPAKCAYIGNKFHRDVVSARQAGFATTGLLRDSSPEAVIKDPNDKPDFFVDNLKDLFEVFPAKQKIEPVHPEYQASISTMWAIDNFPRLSDFFEQARRMGFSEIEINHKVNSAMLEGIDLSQYTFSSVHEPCPSDISTDELKARDWLISASDEDNRIQGVKAIKRSIHLANRIGAPIIVLHAGWVPGLVQLENQMRAMVDSGEEDSEEFHQLEQKMISERDRLIGSRFRIG